MRLLQQIGGPPSAIEDAIGAIASGIWWLMKALGRGIAKLFHGQCPACGRPLMEKKEEPKEKPVRWTPKVK